MPKLSDAQAEQRRTRILDAAELCFARDGFHRTTMQAICREAGISAGALYLYFPSKEALIEGLTSRDRDQILAQFAAASSDGDFLAMVGALLHHCIFSQPIEKATLCIEIGAEATRNPAIAQTMSRFDAEIRGSITQLVAQAQAAGKIAPVAPVEDVVLAMALIGDGLFWRRAVDPSFDPVRAMPQILSMVAALVRPSTSSNNEFAR
ncbi:MAG: TetR family transcriptional regulator [Hyphomicrobiales bacterium]|nr:TetR family transcriptional regulator [Hyphomicrobiales bacterium]